MSSPSRKQEKTDDSAPGRAGALYVHVPFCLRKCSYCDFYSLPIDSPAATAYVEAVLAELSSNADSLVCPLDSVFVGGGTPTSLGAPLLGRLLSALRRYVGPDTEFTVEANPGTVTREIADLLAQTGVNRVSLGVQSLQDNELALLGRAHKAADVAPAIQQLSQAGLANLGVDLIYGICGQTLESWRKTLRGALSLPVGHLSCYALSIEPGTPLERRIRARELAEMDEGLQKDCYLAAIDAARGAGMEQYEISNFSRVGLRCRHNLTYWRNEPYLGIGPGAASFLTGVRRKNRPNLNAYVEAVATGGPPPASQERLTGRKAMAEALMLGLRLTEGVDRQLFIDSYGRDPLEAFPTSLTRYADCGAVRITPRNLRIDPRYFFVSNTILSDILSEA
jgi:oxygen-independent coproporphyrinogen-3 oxidase